MEFGKKNSFNKLALTTCNNNKLYYQWIPYCIKFWKKLDFDFIVYFFSTELPNYLEQYTKNIILITPPKDLYIPSVCQISRLYLPCLHTEYDMVLITDVDLIPLSKTYFSMVDNFSTEKFIAMRKKQNEYFMGFNIASSKMWMKLSGITCNKNDIYNILDIVFEKHKINNILPKKVKWGLDQELLKMYINNLNGTEKQIITNLKNYYILHSKWDYKKAYYIETNKKIDKNKIKNIKDKFIFFTRDDKRKTTNLKKEIEFLDNIY